MAFENIGLGGVLTFDSRKAVSEMRQAERGFWSLSRSSQMLTSSLGRIRDGLATFRFAALAATAVTAGLVVKGVGLLDSYTNMGNQLRQVIGETGDVVSVQEELFNIANRTRSAVESTSLAFSRIGLASEELGVSQKELLQFTESLNQSMILSGATSVEAKNGLIQLSQAMAGGILRAEEFNSIIENVPGVARVIAKSVGVTIGGLRKLVLEGEVTSQMILKAFRDQREEISERFEKMVPTVGQAMVVLRNQVERAFGSAEAQTGAGARIADVILRIADSMDFLSEIVVDLIDTMERAWDFMSDAVERITPFLQDMGIELKDVASFAAKALLALSAFGVIGLVIGGLVSGLGALVSIIAGVAGAALAIVTGPILPILAGLGLAFAVLRKDGESVKGTFGRLLSFLRESFEGFMDFIQPSIGTFKLLLKSVAGIVTELIIPAFRSMLPVFKFFIKQVFTVVKFIARIFQALTQIIAVWVGWIVEFGKKIGEMVTGPFKRAMEFLGISPREQDQISIPQPGDTLGPVPPSAVTDADIAAQAAKAESTTNDLEQALKNALGDRKTEVKAEIKTCVDGRNLTVAQARHRTEILERAGANQAPWQKQQIQTQGVEVGR